VRAQHRRLPGRAVRGDGRLREAARKALPYALTGAQERALAEIGRDMAGSGRMLRLLQGDVGSGKTVVALMAMLDRGRGRRPGGADGADRDSGAPAFRDAAPLCRSHRRAPRLLTGRDKGRARATLARLALGEIDIVVGTHALFQDEWPSTIWRSPSSTNSTASACTSG
jgi:ATP-dependent DNA helicase RecG